MFGIDSARLLRTMVFLLGWLGVDGSAWACGSGFDTDVSSGVFEVIGISPTHLALREYTNLDCDEAEQNCPVECKYAGVSALAKKFGALTGEDLGKGFEYAATGITLHFVRYKPGVPVHLLRKAFEKSFPIYETVRVGRACTSEQAALANLQKAKAFAKKVGIDLKRAVEAMQLKTPKLAAEACFPGTGSKECFFRFEPDGSGVPDFAALVYSLNDPRVCHTVGDETDSCYMPSSTAMQVVLGFPPPSDKEPKAASEALARTARITQDRHIDNAGMHLAPLLLFSSEGRQVLGFVFKFTYGCGAPAPAMHLVVLPQG